MKIILIIGMALISSVCFSAEKCEREPKEVSGIGNIMYSLLPQAEFREVNGDGWVLLKGQLKASFGEDYLAGPNIFKYLKKNEGNYASIEKLPNAGGQFLRAMNYDKIVVDPDSNRLIGSTQIHAFQMHKHKYTNSQISGDTTQGEGLSWAGTAKRINNDDALTTNISNANKVGGPKVESETRPTNIAVNIFIKVRPNCIKDIYNIKKLHQIIAKQQKNIESLIRDVHANKIIINRKN